MIHVNGPKLFRGVETAPCYPMDKHSEGNFVVQNSRTLRQKSNSEKFEELTYCHLGTNDRSNGLSFVLWERLRSENEDEFELTLFLLVDNTHASLSVTCHANGKLVAGGSSTAK